MLSTLIVLLKEVDWQVLGTHLCVPQDKLQSIRADNDTEERRLLRVLHYWSKNEGMSWGRIIEVLKKIGGYAKIIFNIESEHIMPGNFLCDSVAWPREHVQVMYHRFLGYIIAACILRHVCLTDSFMHVLIIICIGQKKLQQASDIPAVSNNGLETNDSHTSTDRVAGIVSEGVLQKATGNEQLVTQMVEDISTLILGKP